MSQARSRAALDRIGTVLSITCALHCLFTPFLVATVSLGAIGSLASEGTELALLALATSLAAVALVLGWRIHRRPGSLGLFAIALSLIGLGRFVAPESAETPMVVAGGLSIALAHVINARFCRLCAGCRAAAESNIPADLSSDKFNSGGLDVAS